MLAPRTRRLLWCAAIGTVTLLAVKTFVVDIYPVGSSSMEPTLHKGEWVLVWHGGGRPDRGEIVVVRHGGDALVKRACGIGGKGGERLTVDPAGDLWVDGQRPTAAERPTPLAQIFDSTLQDPAESFDGLGSEAPGWRVTGAGAFEVGSAEPGEYSASLRHSRILRDGYIDLDRQARPGEVSVHDLVLDLDLKVLARRGTFVLALTEQGDRFELHLHLREGLPTTVSLLRIRGEAEVELSRGATELQGVLSIHLSNVDNRIEARVGDLTLERSYDRNSFEPTDKERLGRSLGSRVQLRARDGHLRVEKLRIARDVQYRPRGLLRPGGVQVGPGEIFLLGDNSADSHDGRDFGCLPEEAVIGRPLFAIWPPKAIRAIQ